MQYGCTFLLNVIQLKLAFCTTHKHKGQHYTSELLNYNWDMIIYFLALGGLIQRIMQVRKYYKATEEVILC